MKTTKMNWMLAILFFAALSFSACKMNGEKKEGETKDTTAVQPASTGGEHAMYVCPMHPEEKSDKPRKCSKCGMDLEKKAE